MLRPNQRALYDRIKRELWPNGYGKPGGTRRFISKAHRRYGKSSVWAVIAFEICLAIPHAQVYWAAETGKQVKKILNTVFRPLLRDCPEGIRPQWKSTDEVYVWPTTGSMIHLAGCEDEAKADRLRGDGADLFVIDEAGAIKPLNYVYRSIALWMVADRDGRIGMPSTPAKTPGHPFTVYSVQAESGERGGFWCQTIEDSEWSPDLIDELAEECGGRETADFRREAYCEDVVDEERAILPEFTEADRDKENPMVCEWERPEYFDVYTVQDLGWSPDLTAVLFGYYDFKNRVYVIEDELGLSRMTTDDLAAGVKAREAALWDAYYAECKRKYRPHYGDEEPPTEPYMRVSDVDLQVIHDLYALHGLTFSPVEKKGDRGEIKRTMINRARLALRQRRVKIHPRCKQLRAHGLAGIWNERGTSYERVDGFGHFDFVDALVYFICSVVQDHNPYPSVPDDVTHETHFIYPREESEAEAVKSLFSREK